MRNDFHDVYIHDRMTERIIAARMLGLPHDRMQVLKIVPHILRHSLKLCVWEGGGGYDYS